MTNAIDASETVAVVKEESPTSGTRLQGFSSLDQEVRIEDVPTRGQFPVWLSGTFMRATPAKFEIGERSLGHWFDGLGMLNVFGFSEGRVSYANRYMQTPRLLDARQGRYRSTVSVGTDPCRRLGARLLSIFDPDAHFEPNINIARFGERYFMTTEAPCPLEFDPATLDTLGFTRDLDHDARDSHMLYDHMQFDPVAGSDKVTVVTRMGVRNEHRIDAINSRMKRRRVGGAPAGRPPEYMHSFLMTERFVVLPLQPLRYSLPGILRSGKFTECLSWRPEDGTMFAVIDRRTGELVSSHKTDAFFFWHTINAYEDGEDIVADIVCDDSPQSLYQIEMDKLRNPDFLPRFYGNARRYRIPLSGGPATGSVISDLRMEFPRINDARNTLSYHHVYGIAYRTAQSDWFDSITKLDVHTGEFIEWQESGCYPGEPIFVAEPGAVAEDEGVVLNVVLDSRTGRSFMLVLDARNMTEIARAELPHHLPFNFHSQYYSGVEL